MQVSTKKSALRFTFEFMVWWNECIGSPFLLHVRIGCVFAFHVRVDKRATVYKRRKRPYPKPSNASRLRMRYPDANPISMKCA